MYGMLTKAERRVRYEELKEMVRRERERIEDVALGHEVTESLSAELPSGEVAEYYVPESCPMSDLPCGGDGEGGCVACDRPRSDFVAEQEENEDA